MGDILEVLADSMRVDLNHLRSISNNLANINTAAYKREVVVNSIFQPYLNPSSGSPKTWDIHQVPAIYTQVSRQYQQGALKATENKYDIALEGEGFFAVKAVNNESEIYTRQGQLMVNNSGLLTLISGERLQGLGGDIFVGNQDFVINERGEIRQDDRLIDKLVVILPRDAQAMEYNGSGFVSLGNDGNNVRPAEHYSVLQGFLETANVDTTTEVINMIEMLRHFEATSNVMRAYDGAIARAINELGKF